MAAASGSLPARHYFAIALVAAAVLVLEIGITRILSVVLWYHFAFLSISLAMLGLGAPGVWFAVRAPAPAALPRALLLAGALLPAAVIAILKLGRPLKQLGQQFPGAARMLDPGVLLIVVAVLVPMLCLGSAICLWIMRVPHRQLGRLYGADLIGATAGALAVVALLGVLPTPLLVAGAGLLPLAAAAMIAPGSRRAAGAIALAFVALAVWGEPFRLHYTKEYAESRDVLYERWTPTARITIFPAPFFTARPDYAFGWGFGTRYEPRPLQQLWIEQDGAAGTPITRLERNPTFAVAADGPETGLEHLLYDVTSIGYQVTPAHRVCVIGAGGGRDVLTALLAGASDVDAVELNPVIPALLGRDFREFSGDPYRLPGVRSVIAEGRCFLTRSRGDYDLLQVSLTDSWAATASGAFALSENYLYTVEAMRLYWRRLAPGGMLSISRWAGADRIHETVRLMLLARRTLELEGIARPGSHLAVASAGDIATLLMTRMPIDDSWAARFDEVCRVRGFVHDWPLAPHEPFVTLTARIMGAESVEYGSQWVDVSPSTDDKPFFFQTVPVFGAIETASLAAMSSNENSVLLLRGLMVWITVLAGALYLVPLLFARGHGRLPERIQGGAYFGAIGLAFMFVEAPWLQRFILYLGHPSYAVAVVLATLLLAAGIGALAAAQVGLAKSRWFLLALPAGIAVSNLALGPVFETTVGASFAARVALAIALVFPAGLLMGFALPAGMLRFGAANRAGFWAMNGIASVVGTVMALALSMVFGLKAVAFAGAAIYALAWLVLSPGLGARARIVDAAPAP